MEDVLKILEQDSRTSPERIAQMTSRPLEEVREIIKSAEADGIILGYSAYVDWRKTGREEVHALVEVKVAPQRGVGFQAMAQRIARFPEVHSLYLVSGDYDLAIQLVAPNIYDISAFISEKVAPLDGVMGTATHFLMRRFKENGVLTVPLDEDSERLPVAP